MPPQPPEETAPAGRSRHETGPDARTHGDGAWAPETSTGRHRRPESLADTIRLRPTSAAPSTSSRVADRRLDRHEFPDGFIERGYPDVSRAAARHAEAMRQAGQRRHGPAARPAHGTPPSRR